MKGLVVVVCAPSQFGKDTLAEKMIQSFPEYFRGGEVESSYATVFKVRESRKNDADHIKCVKIYEEIPISKDSRIEATVYGDQSIAYDKSEIQKKLDNGEVVFIATVSTDLARKVKNEYKDQCFSVLMKGVPIDKSKMVKEDLKRHGFTYHDANESQRRESEKRVSKRLKNFEEAMQNYEDFLQDDELGPDYVFKNWYHFLEGIRGLEDIDSRISRRDSNEFGALLFNILSVYDHINRNKDWKDRYSLSKEGREELKGQLFTMWDSLSEILQKINSKG